MFNVLLLNVAMDIDETRRANICALEKLAGSPTLAANKVGMTYAQYLNYRNGAKEAKTGKIRGMRKETAWRFEDAFGKPRGWLDVPHDTSISQGVAGTIAPSITAVQHARPLVQTVCDLAEKIDDDGLRELIGFARCLSGTHPVVKTKRA